MLGPLVPTARLHHGLSEAISLTFGFENDRYVLGKALKTMDTIEKTSAESLDQSIGRAVRDLRNNQDLSARQLADDSGISTAMISRIESGQASPSIATMNALSQALDVPITSLFRDTVSQSVDFTHVPRGTGLNSTRMMGDHVHHFINLANHRRRDLRFDAHIVTLEQTDDALPVYSSQGVLFMHVLEGEALFQYGRQELELGTGDSLSLDAELTYGFKKIKTPKFVFLNVRAESRL